MPEDITPSEHARTFDHTNSNWNPDPSITSMFIQASAQYLNNLLAVKGVVLVNDVYDSLGIDRSRLGLTHGWAVGDNLEIRFIETIGGESFIDVSEPRDVSEFFA